MVFVLLGHGQLFAIGGNSFNLLSGTVEGIGTHFEITDTGIIDRERRQDHYVSRGEIRIMISSNWIKQDVQDTGFRGSSKIALALDTNNNPHVVYENLIRGAMIEPSLEYARYDGRWVTENIELGIPTTGTPFLTHPQSLGPKTLALGTDNNPHVVYLLWEYGGTGKIKYATKRNGDWHIEILDEGEFLKKGDASLVLDAGNNPHILYFITIDGQPQLKYVRHDGKKWIEEMIDLDGGYNNSLVLDSSDTPHISYYKNGIKYTTKTPTGWATEIITTDTRKLPQVVGFNSIDIDSNNEPHISYYSVTPDFSHVLKYAKRIDNAWTIELIDRLDTNRKLKTGKAVFGSNSITLDSHNYPYISYFIEPQLKLARYNGVRWILETIEPDIGYYGIHSMVINSFNSPSVAYRENFPTSQANQGVKYTALRTELISYKIINGDTLWALAEKYLGDGFRWREIYDFNQSVLESEAQRRGLKSAVTYINNRPFAWIFP